MARPANYRREEAITTLRELTAKHGVKEGVRLARAQFHDVPVGTWSRWRQQAIGNMAGTDAQTRSHLVDELRRNVPAPDLLADPVPVMHRALNFWRMLDELETDARLMREFALVRGADGATKVRVPFALRDAHRMRCDLIRLALQQAETAWSVERAQNFFDAVVAEIGAESSACQKRILERLRTTGGEAAARGF